MEVEKTSHRDAELATKAELGKTNPAMALMSVDDAKKAAGPSWDYLYPKHLEVARGINNAAFGRVQERLGNAFPSQKLPDGFLDLSTPNPGGRRLPRGYSMVEGYPAPGGGGGTPFRAPSAGIVLPDGMTAPDPASGGISMPVGMAGPHDVKGIVDDFSSVGATAEEVQRLLAKSYTPAEIRRLYELKMKDTQPNFMDPYGQFGRERAE
jgi:hypothetical protein